jgi:tyrosine-protein kinase
LTAQPIRSTWRGWIWFVLVGTVVGSLIAAAVAVIAPPGYTAKTTLLVAPKATDAAITKSDLDLAQAYIPTLAEFATLRPLLEKVIQATGVETDVQTLTNNVATRSPVGTSLLEVNVSNSSASNAAALANGIATELQSYASPSGSTSGGANVELTVVDPATPPAVRDGPGLPVRIALGGVIALFLTMSIAFLVENVGRGAQTFGRGVDGFGRGKASGRGSEPSGDRLGVS